MTEKYVIRGESGHEEVYCFFMTSYLHLEGNIMFNCPTSIWGSIRIGRRDRFGYFNRIDPVFGNIIGIDHSSFCNSAID